MMTYSAPSHVVLREVDSEALLVDLRSGDCFLLNAVARLIWETLTSDESEETAVSRVVANYDVSDERAKQDVRLIVDEMLGRGVLAVREA